MLPVTYHVVFTGDGLERTPSAQCGHDQSTVDRTVELRPREPVGEGKVPPEGLDDGRATIVVSKIVKCLTKSVRGGCVNYDVTPYIIAHF